MGSSSSKHKSKSETKIESSSNSNIKLNSANVSETKANSSVELKTKSKSDDVSIFSQIESGLKVIPSRVAQEKYIYSYIKDEILYAIEIYSNELDRKEKTENQDLSKEKEMINSAKEALNKLIVREQPDSMKIKTNIDSKQMRRYLMNLVRYAEEAKNWYDFELIWQNASYYGKKMKEQLDENEKKKVASSVLEVYLKTLGRCEVVGNLLEIIEKIQNVDIQSAQDTAEKMQYILQNLEKLTVMEENSKKNELTLVDKKKDNSTKDSVNGNENHSEVKIFPLNEDTARKNESTADQENLKENASDQQNAEQHSETKNNKNEANSSDYLQGENKCTTEVSSNAQTIDYIKKEISKMMSSTHSLNKKTEDCQSLLEKLDEIHPENETIENEKLKMSNRLKGLNAIITAELKKSERKKLQNLQNYAQNFPFTSNVDLYVLKEAEMKSLGEAGKEIFKLLDKKADENNRIFTNLQLFDDVEKNKELIENLKFEVIFDNRILKKIKTLITQNPQFCDFFLNSKLLSDFSNEVYQIVISELTNTIDRTEDLNYKFSKRIRVLKEMKEELNQCENSEMIEKLINASNNTVKQINELVESIDKCKVDFQITYGNYLHDSLTKIKEDISKGENLKESKTFSEKLEKILYVKNLIDDVSWKCNDKLEKKEKLLNNEIYEILKLLDQSVAEFFRKNLNKVDFVGTQQYENDIKFDKRDNSIEFVRKIREKAETFEKRIDNFLGTKESNDYFIIDNTLTELLINLDKVKTTGDEKRNENEHFETIKYIKGLLTKLEAMAFLSE